MNILLLNPPWSRFIGLEQNYVPLSLLYVGSSLRQCGHNVRIKNLELDDNLGYVGYRQRMDKYSSISLDNSKIWTEVEQAIRTIKPDLIGITSANAKYESVIRIIKISKSLGIPTFVGGPHPTVFPGKYASEWVFVGGRIGKESLSKLGGAQGVICGEKFDLNTPLDYEMLLDKYRPNGYAHVISSVGCPYQCKFCASNTLWNRKVIFKNMTQFLQEMEYIETEFKSTRFTIWDEIFVTNQQRLLEFCLSYNLKSTWTCDSRSDLITNDKVDMMLSSGCDGINIGIESGDQKILDQVGKNETKAVAYGAANILNSKGLKWKAYTIYGFPGETPDQMYSTLEFVKSLRPNAITFSMFTPYPGTPMFQECLDNRIIEEDYDETLYSHQNTNNNFTSGGQISMDAMKDIASQIDIYNNNQNKAI